MHRHDDATQRMNSDYDEIEPLLARSPTPGHMLGSSNNDSGDGPADTDMMPLIKQKRPCCTVRRCLFVSALMIVLAGVAVVGVVYVYPLFIKLEGPGHTAARIAPDTPDPPIIVAVGRSTVSLEWDAPASGTSAIVEFGVQFRNSTETWDDSAPPQLNATDVEATVAQLLGDVEYCFRVRARSDVGPGNYSDESCNTTLAPTKPDAPAAVVPLNSSDISLQVAMLAGEGNGRPIDVMVVETSEVVPSSIGRRRGAAPRAWSFGCSVTPPCPWGCNCTVTGLKADTVYDVRCSANNSIGESPYTDAGRWHTNTMNPVAPDAPSRFTALNRSSTSLVMGWAPPASDGGAMVLWYELQASRGGGDNWVTVGTPVFNSTRVERLLGNTTYCFRARCVNSVATGPWSVPPREDPGDCFVTTAADPPDAPVMLPLPLKTTSTSIRVGWTEPNSNGRPILNYTLERDNFWDDGPFAPVFVGDPQVHDFTTNDSMLPATQYNFRVRAANMMGSSVWSATVNYSTDHAGFCGNPSDVAAYKRTKTTMKPDIQGCMLKCIAGGEDCVVKCINEKVGLSAPCAQCWYYEGKCTLAKCIQPCLNPGSKACAECSQRECFPDCVKCTGIPMVFFPP